MIIRLTSKEMNEINSDCLLSNRKTIGEFPYYVYNVTKDNCYIHDDADDSDIIIFLYDVTNNPVKINQNWKNFLTLNEL